MRRRTNPVSLTAGSDQPRRVGGSGSGVRSLPRRTVEVGQKAKVGPASRAASPGASLRTAMGITQPIAAMHASVMPLHGFRSEEHTSELQSLMRISYAVFCLKKKNKKKRQHQSSSLT